MCVSAEPQVKRDDGITTAETSGRLVASMVRLLNNRIIDGPPLIWDKILDKGARSSLTELVEALNRLETSIAKSELDLASFVDRLVQDDDAWSRFSAKVKEATSYLEAFVKHNPDNNFVEEALFNGGKTLYNAHLRAAKRGWFVGTIATITSLTPSTKSDDDFDAFMLELLRSRLIEFSNQVKLRYPHRSDILSTAFDLHNEGNYIASVPILLMQSDGICAEEMGTFLFTERGRRKAKVEKALEDLPQNHLFGAVLSALIWDIQIGADIKQCKTAEKKNGPNRNGIIHGSRKHLDYGTEINSYKALSLLFFISRLFDPDLGFRKRFDWNESSHRGAMAVVLTTPNEVE